MMPMNRKTFIAATAIFGLLLSIAGLHYADANPIGQPPTFPTTYPTATITFPTNGTTYATNTINCRFSTSIPDWADGPTIEFAAIYLDYQLLQALYNQPTSFILSNLTDGQHNLVVEANVRYFSSFGSTSRTGSSSVNFAIQTTNIDGNSTPTPNPTSTFSASLAESASSLYFGNNINFTVTAQGGKEPYTFSWNVDNQTVETSASPHYSIDTLAIGEHHVFVTVTDAENSTATTLTVAFDVLPNPSSSPAPSPSPSVPEFSAWIILPLVALAATMVIYFRRKRKL
jgi:hypothetical protein